MTAQIPDKLHNDCAAVDLTGLSLYRIVADAPHKPHRWEGGRHELAAQATPDPGIRCSAL